MYSKRRKKEVFVKDNIVLKKRNEREYYCDVENRFFLWMILQ